MQLLRSTLEPQESSESLSDAAMRPGLMSCLASADLSEYHPSSLNPNSKAEISFESLCKDAKYSLLVPVKECAPETGAEEVSSSDKDDVELTHYHRAILQNEKLMKNHGTNYRTADGNLCLSTGNSRRDLHPQESK